MRHRTGSHDIELLTNLQTAAEIRNEIHRRVRSNQNPGATHAILLVGDAPPLDSQSAGPDRQLQTPTFTVTAKVNRHWGGDETFASDNAYADLDGDLLPDVA